MIPAIEHTIMTRRTIRHFSNDPLEEGLLDKLLEQAAYAPFHNKVEPWHVIVASDHAEKMFFLEKVFSSYERNGILKDCSAAQLEKIKVSYMEAFVTPAITLIVSADQFGEEKQDFDAVAATCAFIQNFQLLCWEANIGVVWRSNPFIFDAAFSEEIGVPNGQKIVGALQIGRFNQEKKQKIKERRPLSEWVSKVNVL